MVVIRAWPTLRLVFIHVGIVMVPVVGTADEHSVKYTTSLALFHFIQYKKYLSSVVCALLCT